MIRPLLLVLSTLLVAPICLAAQADTRTSLAVDFEETAGVAISASDQELVRETLTAAAESVRSLLPTLPQDIHVSVAIIDRDLSPVGGVAGRADAPGEVLIEMSATYPGGISAATRDGLRVAFYHELHHLVRGWTIAENKFGPGLPNAVVNEGLASVFAETFTQTYFDRFDYPADVHDWLTEILALPLDASYNTWMNEHPDGRIAVGYRVGRYVVHEAMRRSGSSVLQLSELSPEQILRLMSD